MRVGDNVSESSYEAGTDPERRRPFWIVGSALAGVVVLMLTGAVLLDRHLRPTVGIEPAAAPSAVTQPTATTTGLGVAPSPLERDIQGAFERYLQVYRQAVWDLDASHLQEVLDGKALQLVTDEVNSLRAQGRPVKIIEEERSVALAQVTATTAVVIDEYVSRSVFVDATTREPLPRTGPPTKVRQTYELRNINGAWRIVDGTRQVLSEGTSL